MGMLRRVALGLAENAASGALVTVIVAPTNPAQFFRLKP
jgi:hypothetical protein